MTLLEGATTRGYPMRQWVFGDSVGRFDIDLGDSHVSCGRLNQLQLPDDLELGYGVDRGGGELRGLIAGRYGGSADSILVTHGAQEALYLVYQSMLRPGDRVITFRPGWQQSWDAPAALGCRVDVHELRRDFSIDTEAVMATAGPDVALIVVNTPSNPTGRLTTQAELSVLIDIAERCDAYLLLDEEYALQLNRSAAVSTSRAISVSSLSKVYGLPGLRVGWLYGPPEVVRSCTAAKHLTTISNSVLCEALACSVLAHHQDYLEDYRRLTSQGLAQLSEWADRHAGQVQLVAPQGTPFAWLNLSTGEPSLDFCRRVLDTGVLLMPAETLGGSAGFRLCFAREPSVLAQGLERIGVVLDQTAVPGTSPSSAHRFRSRGGRSQ